MCQSYNKRDENFDSIYQFFFSVDKRKRLGWKTMLIFLAWYTDERLVSERLLQAQCCSMAETCTCGQNFDFKIRKDNKKNFSMRAASMSR